MTTSALIGKSYMVAGQAGMALHTMAILQVYQTDFLKEMDENRGLGAPQSYRPYAACKHTACMVGQTMASLVAIELHIWLNLTEI